MQKVEGLRGDPYYVFPEAGPLRVMSEYNNSIVYKQGSNIKLLRNGAVIQTRALGTYVGENYHTHELYFQAQSSQSISVVSMDTLEAYEIDIADEVTSFVGVSQHTAYYAQQRSIWSYDFHHKKGQEIYTGRLPWIVEQMNSYSLLVLQDNFPRQVSILDLEVGQITQNKRWEDAISHLTLPMALDSNKYVVGIHYFDKGQEQLEMYDRRQSKMAALLGTIGQTSFACFQHATVLDQNLIVSVGELPGTRSFLYSIDVRKGTDRSHLFESNCRQRKLTMSRVGTRRLALLENNSWQVESELNHVKLYLGQF